MIIPSSVGNPVSGVPPDKTSSVAHLSSAILDTLLCVLVDSSAALRTFEDVNGVQAVVKLLKRAGTPREVRYVIGISREDGCSHRSQDEMP